MAETFDRTTEHAGNDSAPAEDALTLEPGDLELRLGIFKAWKWAIGRPQALFKRLGVLYGVYGEELLLRTRDVPDPLFVVVVATMIGRTFASIVAGRIGEAVYSVSFGVVDALFIGVVSMALGGWIVHLFTRMLRHGVSYSLARYVVGYALGVSGLFPGGPGPLVLLGLVGTFWFYALLYQGLKFSFRMPPGHAFSMVVILFVLSRVFLFGLGLLMAALGIRPGAFM